LSCEDIENILYPKKDKDTVTKTAYGIIQNQEAKVALDLGFELDKKVDVNSLKELNAISKSALEKIENAESAEALEAAIESIKTELASSEAVSKHIDAEASGSLNSCYAVWLKSKKVIS
jgi:hypothetical protein